MRWIATYSQVRPWGLVGSITLMMLATLVLAAPRCAAQTLRKGIHVEMAVTHNAVAMPEADQADAIIVAVTHDGSIYLGIDPITPAALAEKRDMFSRAGEKLYIKADARVPYATLIEVLDAVRAAGVTAPGLLTNQPETPQPGKLMSPKGLEVLLGPPMPSGAESTVVQVLNSGKQEPTLKINNQNIPLASLDSQLKQHFQRTKMVLVKADGQLPYANVVHVIDACRATGAQVFLAPAGM